MCLAFRKSSGVNGVRVVKRKVDLYWWFIGEQLIYIKNHQICSYFKVWMFKHIVVGALLLLLVAAQEAMPIRELQDSDFPQILED